MKKTKPGNPDNGSAQSIGGSGAGHGNSRERDDNAREPGGPARIQAAVAIILIGVYIAILWVMFSHRADKDWDRMVFLLSGYEAVVFVAVGYMFGTQVQRGSVEIANKQAEQARDDMHGERRRADGAVRRKGAADALAKGVMEFADQPRSAPPGATGQNWNTGPRGGDPADRTALAILTRLANDVLEPDEQAG